MSPLVVWCALIVAPQDPPGSVVQSQLARVVDLPTGAQRQQAVGELLRKVPASLAEWTTACASFGTFAPMEPGPTRQTVDLQVLDQVEKTEIFLYVPKGHDPAKPAPLLLWGHGAGGSGAREYLQWQQVADQVGMLVLAITEFGKEPGWGSSPRERAAQLAALRWARRAVDVDENAVFVGGWSRGGHMAWDLMLRHPDRFAGALPCVGGPRILLGPTNNLRYLENVAHLPIRDLQGSQDDPLLLVNLRLAFARLQKFGAKDAVLKEFPELGHSAELGVVDWTEFFTRRRTPVPPRVVRVAADKSETRAAWLVITGFEPKVVVEAAPQVDPNTWNRLDDTGQRALLLDKLADHTARLAVQDKGQGRFSADGRLVRSFELLLTAAQLGKDDVVEVAWQGRTIRKKVSRDPAVLLREFVETFDRTFLPIAKVAIP